MKLHNNKDPHYEKISYYVILTSIAIFILYRLAAHFDDLMSALGKGISWFVVILTPIFWGLVLAYLLKPSMKFFEKKLKNSKYYKNKEPKKARTMAVTVTWLLILAVVTIVFSLMLSAFTKEVKFADIDSTVAMFEGIANSMQAFYKELINGMNSLNMNSDALTEWLDQLIGVLGSKVNDLGSNIVNNASGVTSSLTNLAFAIIFSIYFMADGERIRSYWSRVSKALFSKKFNDGFKVLSHDADIAFSGYIRGQLMDALIMAILIAITLSLVGVKFAIVIGVLAGIGNLIPYVGPFIAYALTVLVCLISNDFNTMFVAIISLLVIQTIDGQIINPRLLGSTVNVHPMYVIVAIIFGESLGGFMGMIFAVPVAALIKIEFDRLVEMKLKKKTLS